MKCGKQQGHGISKITLTLTTFLMKFTFFGFISASVVRRLILSPHCLPLSPVRTLVPVYWALWVCRPAPRRRPSTARLKRWAAAACWTARCPTRSPPTSSRWADLVWTCGLYLELYADLKIHSHHVDYDLCGFSVSSSVCNIRNSPLFLWVSVWQILIQTEKLVYFLSF